MNQGAGGVRRRRHEIHIGDLLRGLLRERAGKLSTVVNTIVDRYIGMVSRAGRTPMMTHHAELYCNVLREAGRPLTSKEIVGFPAACEDWLTRHPEFPPEPGKTAVMILKNSPFVDLVALVDQMECEINRGDKNAVT